MLREFASSFARPTAHSRDVVRNVFASNHFDGEILCERVVWAKLHVLVVIYVEV